MCRAADNFGTAWIKKSSVAITAEEIDIFPGILLFAISFGCAEVQFALDAIFPCDPFHNAVSNGCIIDHVARPASEIVSAYDIASMAATRLVPPQLFAVRKFRVVFRPFRHRLAEIVVAEFSFEAVDGWSPNIDKVRPIRMERCRHQILNRGLRTADHSPQLD